MGDDAAEVDVLVDDPRRCACAQGGVVVSIHRALLDGPALSAFAESVESVAPEGLVLLTIFRLDPRYPLTPSFDTAIPELVATLRRIERRFTAIAAVPEFGGVRRASLRVVSRAVWTLAQPRCEQAIFDRMTDAARWLGERAPDGPARDLATYFHLYRAADARLRARA